MNKAKPLVSIIMPVYNVEAYVAKAITSVLDQSYPNFELLVVNDGTPDNSVAIIEKFCQQDDRVQLLHKENGGLSDARNFGLPKVKGDFVYFMDSDDWIAPNLLEVAVVAMESQSADVVVFGYHMDTEDAKGVLVGTKIVNHKKALYQKSKASEMVIDRTLLNLYGYAWNKLYRTDFLKQHQLIFDKGISLVEDILFNARVLGVSDRIAVLEDPCYHYIHRIEGVTLIKTYHENSFDLILKRTAAIKQFLSQWYFDEPSQSAVLGESLVLGIRYCVNNLFAYKNQLNFGGKRRVIHHMLSHPETTTYVDHYVTYSFFDKVYKFLIKNKYSFVLAMLCLIKK